MQVFDHHDRLRGALWGMFVGDALAMPAHWYYDVAALQRDFGEIRDYQSPKDHHPNSIMSLANTGKAGRGNQEGEVVGGVILRGKKNLWARPNRHYHYGLRAGENTLNLLCARVLIRSMVASRRYDPDAFLEEYVAFMTAEDSHRDTYAESYHRDFFANFVRGVPLNRCAGAEGHDTASIGGLVGLTPVILASLREQSASSAETLVLEHMRLTHRSNKLERYAQSMNHLMRRLFLDTDPDLQRLASEVAEAHGFPATRVIERMKQSRRSDLEVIGRMLSPACYIDQSFPAVLYLAGRYANDFESALIANTNVGGDNCHRGSVLGAILGATLGWQAIPERWIHGLVTHAELNEEIESFVLHFG